jgi:hypothetical protein
MNWFTNFFRRHKEEETESQPSPTEPVLTTNPTAHHVILEYLRSIWNGAERDNDFEQKSLTNDIDFNLVNLAELTISVCKERNLSLERVIDFSTIMDVGGQQHLTTLLKRLQILMKSFGEEERIKLIDSGVVGDRKEVLPIFKEFDKVEFVVKIMLAFEGANKQIDHDAIDEEFGYVE